jgi:hypothetical protein
LKAASRIFFAHARRVDGVRPSDGRNLQPPRLFGPRFWLLLLGC